MEEFDFMEQLRLKIRDEVRNRSEYGRGGQMVFHGTNRSGREGIEESGFRRSQQGWYGPGVYATHSPDVGADFTRGNLRNRLIGVLPDGFRYRTMPTDMTTEEFLKKLGIREQGHNPLSTSIYDIRSSAQKRFPRMDGIRIPGAEDQLLIFDEKLANTVFESAGGKKGETKLAKRKRELQQAKTPANTNRAANMLIKGNRNGLLNTVTQAQAGNELADLVTQISEALFGPLSKEKKNSDKLKIK